MKISNEVAYKMFVSEETCLSLSLPCAVFMSQMYWRQRIELYKMTFSI